MTDLVRDDGAADAGWERVARSYIVVDVASYLLRTIVVTAIATVPWWIWQQPWLWALSIATAVVGLVIVGFTPRRVGSIAYRLRDDDIVFARGIAWRRSVAIPYGRMQLVDLTAGPVSRVLGLSELRFVTAAASGTVTIPGLPVARAEQLRDRLVQLAEERRAGL